MQRQQRKSRQPKRIRDMSALLTKGPDLSITRRICTFSGGILSSTAGSLIALNTCSSDTVRTIGSPEFTSYSARFLQFRVRRVLNRYYPVWPLGSNVVGATGNLNHGVIYSGTFYGASSPGTGQALLSSDAGRAHRSCDTITVQANWDKNPSAKLWTPVGSAIVASAAFGVAICGPLGANSTLVPSVDYFTVVNEWDVEFSGET
jgi:hypothetical protein